MYNGNHLRDKSEIWYTERDKQESLDILSAARMETMNRFRNTERLQCQGVGMPMENGHAGRHS